jgi:hypothetical protein
LADTITIVVALASTELVLCISEPTPLINKDSALIDDVLSMLEETVMSFCKEQDTEDSLVIEAAMPKAFSTVQDTDVLTPMAAEQSLTITESTVIELSDAMFADVLTNLSKEQDTSDELSMLAEASKIPPPASVEKGVSENALMPNIISNVHYQTSTQTKLQFLGQQSRKTF